MADSMPALSEHSDQDYDDDNNDNDSQSESENNNEIVDNSKSSSNAQRDPSIEKRYLTKCIETWNARKLSSLDSSKREYHPHICHAPDGYNEWYTSAGGSGGWSTPVLDLTQNLNFQGFNPPTVYVWCNNGTIYVGSPHLAHMVKSIDSKNYIGLKKKISSMKEKILVVKEKLKHLKDEREAVLAIEPQDRQKYQKAKGSGGKGSGSRKTGTGQGQKRKASKQPRLN